MEWSIHEWEAIINREWQQIRNPDGDSNSLSSTSCFLFSFAIFRMFSGVIALVRECGGARLHRGHVAQTAWVVGLHIFQRYQGASAMRFFVLQKHVLSNAACARFLGLVF